MSGGTEAKDGLGEKIGTAFAYVIGGIVLIIICIFGVRLILNLATGGKVALVPPSWLEESAPAPRYGGGFNGLAPVGPPAYTPRPGYGAPAPARGPSFGQGRSNRVCNPCADSSWSQNPSTCECTRTRFVPY